MYLQITIDGPSGVGKSTLSKALAQTLGYLCVNTGLIFRGLAWYFIKENISIEEMPKALETLSREQTFVFDNNAWFLNGIQVPNNELINQEISSRASLISKYIEVRNYVLKIEKDLSKKHNIVMEGRDIGTAVFPEAFLKIFLVASEEIRSQRRYEELKAKGLLNGKTLEDIKREISKRDEDDSKRDLAPLVKPDDAIVLCSDHKDVETLIQEIKSLLQEKLSKQQVLREA